MERCAPCAPIIHHHPQHRRKRYQTRTPTVAIPFVASLSVVTAKMKNIIIDTDIFSDVEQVAINLSVLRTSVNQPQRCRRPPPRRHIARVEPPGRQRQQPLVLLSACRVRHPRTLWQGPRPHRHPPAPDQHHLLRPPALQDGRVHQQGRAPLFGRQPPLGPRRRCLGPRGAIPQGASLSRRQQRNHHLDRLPRQRKPHPPHPLPLTPPKSKPN
jgi:hypothetical protein